MRTKTTVKITDHIILEGIFQIRPVTGGYKISPGNEPARLELYLGDVLIFNYISYSYKVGNIKINKKGLKSCILEGPRTFYLIDNTTILLATTAAAANKGPAWRIKN